MLKMCLSLFVQAPVHAATFSHRRLTCWLVLLPCPATAAVVQTNGNSLGWGWFVFHLCPHFGTLRSRLLAV